MEGKYKKIITELNKEMLEFMTSGKTPKQRIKIDIELEGKDALTWRALLALADEDKKTTLVKDIIKGGLHLALGALKELMDEVKKDRKGGNRL